MRLSYIEPIRLPTEKAHGYQIMKTCEALVAAGVTVDLAVAGRRNPIGEKDVFKYYDLPASFTVRHLPVFDLLGRLPSDRIAFRLMFRSFVRSIRRNRFGLALADAWYARDPATAGVLLGLPNSKPVFLELHNATDTRSLLRLAGWIVISQGLKNELLKQGVPEEKILIARDGFDPAAFEHQPSKQEARGKLGLAQDAFLVVYAGHLYPWKGMDGIASAFRDIPEGVELAVVGGYPSDIERIKSIAGETRCVRFVGQRPRAEVSTWLAAADAALLPTSAKFEIGKSYTSPLKLFEYLAAGLPILASDVPSNHEILDESVARFFKPDDAQDFLQQLTEMKNAKFDPQTARDRVKPYAWSERGKKIAAFIASHTKPVPVLTKKGMLIVAQAVDATDTNLAFFLSWLREIASRVSVLHVAAWKVGPYDLPSNVHIHEMPKGKFRRIVALKLLSWRLRHEIDAVFVHMLAPVAAVLAPFWHFILRKRVVLWYTHGSVPFSLRVANRFVHAICTATDASLRLKTAKKIVTGHGIDSGFFKPGDQPRMPEMITVGRISPRKHLERVIELADAVRRAHPGLTFRLRIIGDTYLETDKAYEVSLKKLVADRQLGDIVTFEGAKLGNDLVAAYQRAAVFVTESATGSLDKVVLEALACGTPVLAASSVFAGFKGVQVVEKGSAPASAAVFLARPQTVPEARADVEAKAGLPALISRLITVFFS